MHRKTIRRSIAVALASGVLAAVPMTPAEAKDQQYNVTSSCSYRVSGFYDWSKAASSTRDLSSCNYIKTRLRYGTVFNTWTSTSGNTTDSYVKQVAGYYDWKTAEGAASNNGYVWNGFSN